MGAAPQPPVKGLHHVTLVTSREPVNRLFYTEILGLRRVKLSVNQDDILHRHVFYGDERGSSGSVITFFEWPHLPEGQAGLGSPHHLAYTVKNLDALLKWASLLRSRGVRVSGVYVVGERISIYFKDPDGALIELTCRDDEGVDQSYLNEAFSEELTVESVSADMRLRSIDHASPIATDAGLLERFLFKTLGLRRVSRMENPHDLSSVILGMGSEENDFLRYIVRPGAPQGSIGIGSIHHVAVKVMDEDEQKEIIRTLDSIGIPHSGIVDRFWFKSVYFRDPFGNLLEVATDGPGYTVDEPQETLGSRLALPPWLEPKRRFIEDSLSLLDARYSVKWPPKYPPAPEMPERLK